MIRLVVSPSFQLGNLFDALYPPQVGPHTVEQHSKRSGCFSFSTTNAAFISDPTTAYSEDSQRVCLITPDVLVDGRGGDWVAS